MRISSGNEFSLTLLATVRDTSEKYAVIDEQGRLEIPVELREQLHMKAGAVVNFKPVEQGLQITTTPLLGAADTGAAKLEWDNGLLVDRRTGVLPFEDVNQTIEAGRQEHFDRILGVASNC
jgi:hypothetical protein